MFSNKEIGNLVKKAREIKSKEIGEKYTGQMLADELGISRSFLGDIESGRAKAPDYVLDEIIRICSLKPDFFKKSESSTPLSIDISKDITDVEEAMRVILSQPGLMLNGELLSDEDKIKVANAIIIGLRYAAEQIEKEKKER